MSITTVKVLDYICSMEIPDLAAYLHTSYGNLHLVGCMNFLFLNVRHVFL